MTTTEARLVAAKGQGDPVFESAAESFGLLSTPVRLKLISAVCNGERNVSEVLAQIDTTQPNMSQHLATLYRAVCTHVAVEMDANDSIPAAERLTRAVHR